jgi:hypothetical protein
MKTIFYAVLSIAAGAGVVVYIGPAYGLQVFRAEGLQYRRLTGFTQLSLSRRKAASLNEKSGVGQSSVGAIATHLSKRISAFVCLLWRTRRNSRPKHH